MIQTIRTLAAWGATDVALRAWFVPHWERQPRAGEVPGALHGVDAFVPDEPIARSFAERVGADGVLIVDP